MHRDRGGERHTETETENDRQRRSTTYRDRDGERQTETETENDRQRQRRRTTDRDRGGEQQTQTETENNRQRHVIRREIHSVIGWIAVLQVNSSTVILDKQSSLNMAKSGRWHRSR